jgi:hypothetical protein
MKRMCVRILYCALKLPWSTYPCLERRNGKRSAQPKWAEPIVARLMRSQSSLRLKRRIGAPAWTPPSSTMLSVFLDGRHHPQQNFSKLFLKIRIISNIDAIEKLVCIKQTRVCRKFPHKSRRISIDDGK